MSSPDTVPASAPAPASANVPAPSPVPSKPKGTRRPKVIKRRGVRVEEEEDEEGSTQLPGGDGEPTSDSDSDFSVAEDEDEEDDSGSEADAPADAPETTLPTPPPPLPTFEIPSSLPTLATANGTTTLPASSPAPLDPFPHPSWADIPVVGDEDLPTLDFATLDPIALAASGSPARGPTPADPSPSTSIAPPAGASTAPRLSKTALAAARREAKAAALKTQDPVAWEAMEKERKAREAAKRKEKKERKRQERLGTAPAVEGAAPPGVAQPSAPSSEAAPALVAPLPAPNARPTRGPVPSRPSRTALSGLVPSLSSSVHPPADSFPPSQPQAPFRNGAPYPPRSYVNAREAYAERLATDPQYTPRIGRFWSHDDRLAPPDLRPLTQGWTGRGGRGGRGRGRGARGGFEGGRGGFEGGRGAGPASGSGALNPGWDISGADGSERREEVPSGQGWDASPQALAEQRRGVAAVSATEPTAELQEAEDDGDEEEDDGWGRGEAKRKNRPAIPADAPAAIPTWNHSGFDELKDSRPPRGAGGARGGRGGRTNGPPGAINPAYAHLPFHPKHRFPPVPSAAHPPPPEETTTSQPEQSTLFDPPTGVPSVVKLPGRPAVDEDLAAQTSALALDPAPAPVEPRGVVVNLGGRKPVTVFPRSAEEKETAEQVERRQGGTNILYAADPERLSRAQDPSAVAPQQQQQQQQQPLPAQYYQLPPHIQPGPQAMQQQGHFIPRLASPAYYPQHYWSPEPFPNMPTPGATPPPLFFAPAHQSKVEIKAPGARHASTLSATGDAFQPTHRASPSIPYSSAHAPSFQPQSTGSPASSASPQLANPYPTQQQQQQGYYGYPSDAENEYLQAQQQQQYYDQYYGQQVDPAILQYQTQRQGQGQGQGQGGPTYYGANGGGDGYQAYPY